MLDTYYYVLWYGLGRPVITSEISNWSVFVLVRMAFYIRDNHEMRRAKAPHLQMSSWLWWTNKAASLIFYVCEVLSESEVITKD